MKGLTTEKIKIHVSDGKTREVSIGTPVGEVLEDDGTILAAAVDYLTVGLHYRLKRSATVTPLRYNCKQGNEVYRRTLSFLACAACRNLFPDLRLSIGHSLAGGYYFDVEGRESLTTRMIQQIEEEMRRLVDQDSVLTMECVSVTEAMRQFEERGRSDKLDLLRRSHDFDITIYRLGDYLDMPIGPLAPTTGRLSHFQLIPYPPGLVLRFPDKRNIEVMSEASDQTRLFAVYHESKKWSKILNIRNVGDLNELIAQKKFHECVQVAEGLHEKKIAMIADEITDRAEETRFVFIAGPSSSGKTTFAKRLSVQLKVNGLRPIALGLDDYFVDRELTPRDESGDFDFESVFALNIELLNEHLLGLLSGEEVIVPRFDFKLGKSLPGSHHIKLEDDQVLIVEGIHGLNESLTPKIPSNNKFKIYVSALTQLTIDNMNRIPTTDTRLIRRLVRDHHYRGYTAAETIRRWPSVIRGEAKNIFPFQEGADVIFNTGLLYEFAVLKRFAWSLLEEVTPTEPEFAESRRMLEFFHHFSDGDTVAIPPNSLLREFIGGSSFNY